MPTGSTLSKYTACWENVTVRLFPALSCGTLRAGGQAKMKMINNNRLG